MRRILPYLMAIAIIGPGMAYGLGLGKLIQQSGLSEPFLARIDLTGIDPESAGNLSVRLASNDQFRRAGLSRPEELNKLKFSIVDDADGPDHILVTSREPIVEPFLNFLLELNWPKGRLLREYTVLLDPPIYDPTPRPVAEAAPASPGADAMPAPAPEQSPAPTTAPAPATASSGTSGGDFGRATQAGDTLWSIATQVRPDDSLSVQQTMLALLRANPEAFSENNVNTLKRGYVLRVPDYDEINSLSRSEALDQVREQHAAWQGFRSEVADAVETRSDGGAETLPEAPADTEEPMVSEPEQTSAEAEARLELVSVEDEGGAGTAGAQPDAAALEDMDLDALRRELALAKEALAASDSENADLRGELQDTEDLVDSLERLIQLRETELASLQDQFADDVAQETLPEEAEELVDDLADMAGVEEDEVSDEIVGEMPAQVEEPAIDEETLEEEVEAAEDMVEDIADVAEADEEIEVVDFGDEAVDEGGGIMDTVTGILDKVPGGLKTVLGALAALIGIPALLVARRRKADQEMPAAASVASTAAATDDDDDDATVVASSTEDDDFDLGEDEDTTISAAGAEVDDSEDITDVPTDAPVTESPAMEVEEEEDPLAEINVYLAYERFDQAEALVRDALENEPDNHGYRVRLLEVFYASGDKASYEAAARELHDAVGGEGEHWETALAMWSAMSPDRELFAEGAADVGAEAADDADKFVDITAGEEAEAAGDTVTIRPETRAELEEGAADVEDGGLDLDLTSGNADEAEDLLDLTAATGEDLSDTVGEPDDDVLDLTAASGAGAAEEQFDATAEKLEDTAAGLDFNILADSGSDTDGVLDVSADSSQSDDEDVLDITAGDSVDEDVLDLTATAAEDPLDVTATGDIGSLDGEDLLNVTAPGAIAEVLGDDDEDAGGDLLDLTAGSDEVEFDISGDGDDAADSGISTDGEADDLLDLTAGGDTVAMDMSENESVAAVGSEDETVSLDADAGEDILDLSADSSDDLTQSLDLPETEGDDDTLDFDIGELDSELTDSSSEDETVSGLEIDLGETVEAPSTDTDEDMLDLTAALEEDTLQMPAAPDLDSAAEETGLEIDIDKDETLNLDTDVDDDGALDLTISQPADSIDIAPDVSDDESFDLDLGEDTAAAEMLEAKDADAALSTDDESDEDAFDLDLGLEDSTDLSIALEETSEIPPSEENKLEDTVTGLTMGDTQDLSARDDGKVVVGESEHMATVQINSIDDLVDAEEDESDQTVAMPRDENAETQSEEDEVDTKLNLAKAYIELGDNEGARTVLEDVRNDGTDEQRAEAESLIAQLD